MTEPLTYGSFTGNTPGKRGIIKRSAYNGIRDVYFESRPITYVIQANDGAYKIASALSKLAKTHITPRDVIRHNPALFESVQPNPYDLENPQHKNLPIGPLDLHKLATVWVVHEVEKVYEIIAVKADYEVFRVGDRTYGVKIDANIEGEAKGSIVIATGFDDWAKLYVGLELKGSYGGTYQTGRGWSTGGGANLSLIYGGEVAYTYHTGSVLIWDSSGNYDNSYYNPMISVKKSKAMFDGSVNQANIEPEKKKRAGIVKDLQFFMNTSADTVIYTMQAGIGGKAQADLPIVGLPYFAARAELSGEIGISGFVTLKVFEIEKETHMFEYRELSCSETPCSVNKQASPEIKREDLPVINIPSNKILALPTN